MNLVSVTKKLELLFLLSAGKLLLFFIFFLIDRCTWSPRQTSQLSNKMLLITKPCISLEFKIKWPPLFNTKKNVCRMFKHMYDVQTIKDTLNSNCDPLEPSDFWISRLNLPEPQKQ